MKDGFQLRIETLHVDKDRGLLENVHKLTEAKLKQRSVYFINIADVNERDKYK